jgi:hypothetical protein
VVGAAIVVMDTSPRDRKMNEEVMKCLFFNSEVGAD